MKSATGTGRVARGAGAAAAGAARGRRRRSAAHAAPAAASAPSPAHTPMIHAVLSTSAHDTRHASLAPALARTDGPTGAGSGGSLCAPAQIFRGLITSSPCSVRWFEIMTEKEEFSNQKR